MSSKDLKRVFLGTWDFANGGTVAAHDLTGGEITELAGKILADIVVDIRTPLTSGGSATIQLRTDADTALTAAIGIASINDKAVQAFKSLQLSAADVASAFNVNIGTAAMTAGVLDFYGFVFDPRN